MSTLPDPGKYPAKALADALRYPLGVSALATNATLLLGHLVALFVPVLGTPMHLLVLLGLYKYALEILTSSAEGGTEPPEGWSAVDPGVQVHHYWLQLLVLGLLLVVTQIVPEVWRLGLLTLLALLMPGMVLALAIAQNLATAINPLAWLKIGAQLGAAYLLLASASWPVLWFQAHGGELVTASGMTWLALPVFYLLSQHAVMSLFRLMGLAAQAHAEAFGFQHRDSTRPVLARDKQHAYQSEAVTQALQVTDLAERAAQLRPQLVLGAEEALHREYRRCLREIKDRPGLHEHAQRRVCELLNLDQPRLAVALANEALADEPGFCPVDALHCDRLASAAERMTLIRQAARLLANYRSAFPKRYDGLPLAMRAARWYADHLNEPDVALRLLRSAQPLTESGQQSADFARAIERLQQGLPITEPSSPTGMPPASTPPTGHT